MKDTFLNIAVAIFFAIVVFLFFRLILSLCLIIILIGIFWTFQIQKDPQNNLFLRGTLPNPAPDGLHQGIFLGHNTSWRGKKFNVANSTGINLFYDKKARHNTAPGSSAQVERYPFKTYAGKGLRDKKLDVLKIDYNVEGNPFWLRLIVDEIVEVTPGRYLGKMHIKIIPGFPFTVLYFELKK